MKIKICLLLGIVLVSLLTSCRSYHELGLEIEPTNVVYETNEKPLATFVTVNVSYKLFGLIPLTSGTGWTVEEAKNDVEGAGMVFFKDVCTIDTNLDSLKAALQRAGSNRICNLNTTITENYAWSAFLIKRRMVKTSCIILEPKK